MLRLTRNLLGCLALLLLVVLSGCGSEPQSTVTRDSPSGSNGEIVWGDGSYGVVLAHGAAFDAASWEEQARAMADQGATVVAVEDISPDGIMDAVENLFDDGLDDVALVGGSAGADAILKLSSEQPDLADQLILLSPNTTVEGLGDQPKLFIASEEESVADVSTRLAGTAAGDRNDVVLLPGAAHAQNIFDGEQGAAALELVLERLAEYAEKD